jgi:hypothetical protein
MIYYHRTHLSALQIVCGIADYLRMLYQLLKLVSTEFDTVQSELR